ncbi:MAG: transposase [Anaerolineales bacterium]|jgi:putative transposase
MPIDYKHFYRRHLPHYQPPGATFFITFRLAGSLTAEVHQRFEDEAQRKALQIKRMTDSQLRQQAAHTAQMQLFEQWDSELDTSRSGPRWLAEPAFAQLMCEALHYRDGRVYKLEAYSVMPNHVHLVCTPLSGAGGFYSLSKIMQSLKGFTAWQANRLLKRKQDFWQHENYDHVVRNEDELQEIIKYVLENPLRAGLPERWVYCRTSC